MMIEAARADLYAQLSRQIKGLQISDTTLVADHAIDESDRMGQSNAWLRGVMVGDPEFIDDMCLVPGSITIDHVVENLKSWKRLDSNGRQISYESIKRQTQLSTLNAVGAGARRDRPTEASSSTLAPAPSDGEGLKDTLSALQGSGQQKLGALEAARMDALVNLVRQIKGLQISDTSFVHNMAADGRWTEASSDALIKGARVLRYKSMAPDLAVCVMIIDLQDVVENIQRRQTTFSDGREISFERVKKHNADVIQISATGFGAISDGRVVSGLPIGRIIGEVR